MHIERHHAKYWVTCQLLYTSLFDKHVIGCQLTVVDSSCFSVPSSSIILIIVEKKHVLVSSVNLPLLRLLGTSSRQTVFPE